MDWSVFPLFLGACGAAAATGAMFSPGQWYRDLSKPIWTPPDWLFPLAWTVLYICSAIAATRVAVLGDSAHAMGFWAFQIALNTLWTPVFFGLERIRAGALVLSFLWISVAGCMVTFFMADTLAGLLIVPYLVWVTIAGALNLSVWRLNPEKAALG
ncbi:tryptophan-rich sensory protein [Rhodobacteraceae bacterium N5(2021)]|uniref:Tryptophan-rich sensory protein n=1 Tax=Gymnodinialimonas phycosphaerae TaxID=2841589 RepID=A0A975TTX8_9RHOB|nr:TspO/MBR family protein [Gymnodinialimonas phycosphaerae]MBY4894123.1 tryptophan-rich sensory protein [Gymnodinialimonas phycosphaerae]